MSALTDETLLPLARAAELVPPARSGKRCHLSTLLRWIIDGCRSPSGTVVRLEGVRLGNRWMTSREALQRFADRLTPRPDGDPSPAPRTPAARRRASERAAAELDNAGI
jgi:hypothetical protein